MRVLVIEDDKEAAAYLVKALGEVGHAAERAGDGETGAFMVGEGGYDVVIVDRMLPKRDGLSVLQALRQSGSTLPILILTARDGLEDRVRGLDLGADDYLVKPFESAELLARIRAVARRQGGQAQPLLSNGVMELDPVTREVRFQGQTQRLTAREYALLHALLLRPGAILSRSELEDRIYGWNEEVESNAVEYLIHSLRRKLAPEVIKNVRGVGWLVPRAESTSKA